MYIRSLFEANKHVRDPRQQRASLPSARVYQLKLIVGSSDFIQRDGGSAREMEASGSVSSTNRTRRFVSPELREPDILRTMLTMSTRI
jgi:hypothetical protein